MYVCVYIYETHSMRRHGNTPYLLSHKFSNLLDLSKSVQIVTGNQLRTLDSIEASIEWHCTAFIHMLHGFEDSSRNSVQYAFTRICFTSEHFLVCKNELLQKIIFMDTSRNEILELDVKKSSYRQSKSWQYIVRFVGQQHH